MNQSTETKKFKPEDVAAVVSEVRRLATEYPDFVYRNGDEVVGCSNLEGGDTKYPHLEGCIIGQAVRNLGFEIPCICEEYNAARLLSHLYDETITCDAAPHPDLSPTAIEWLTDVQINQDASHPWRDAVSLADNGESRWEKDDE